MKDNYTQKETIIKVTPSTPVLKLLFLRNEISSRNDYKTRNSERVETQK